MPIIPLVRVKSADEAIDLAMRGRARLPPHGDDALAQHRHGCRAWRARCNCSIFVKNGPAFAGLGLGGEGYTSFTIASPTGEGLTTARTFTRIRRCTLVDYFRIV